METLKQINNLLSVNKFSRGDYYELADLNQHLDLNYNDIRIRQPGAVHHARFLSQSIYYMKLKIMEKILNLEINEAVQREIERGFWLEPNQQLQLQELI